MCVGDKTYMLVVFQCSLSLIYRTANLVLVMQLFSSIINYVILGLTYPIYKNLFVFFFFFYFLKDTSP